MSAYFMWELLEIGDGSVDVEWLLLRGLRERGRAPRPAARDCAIDVDERLRRAPVRVRRAILGFERGALGVEHLQEIGGAALETQARELRSAVARLCRAVEQLALVARLRVFDE